MTHNIHTAWDEQRTKGTQNNINLDSIKLTTEAGLAWFVTDKIYDCFPNRSRTSLFFSSSALSTHSHSICRMAYVASIFDYSHMLCKRNNFICSLGCNITSAWTKAYCTFRLFRKWLMWCVPSQFTSYFLWYLWIYDFSGFMYFK